MTDEASWLNTLRPSRIREVQAGAPSWTSLDLVDVDSGHGPALRSALETFGVGVTRVAVGQARHLVHALAGPRRAPSTILACHGEDGSLRLPELAAEVERYQPFHRRVRPDDLRFFDGTVVIATGCDTGHPDLVRAVLDCGANAYLAPV